MIPQTIAVLLSVLSYFTEAAPILSSAKQSSNHTFSYLDDIADFETIRRGITEAKFLRRDEEVSSRVKVTPSNVVIQILQY